MNQSKYRRWTSDEDVLLKELYNKKTLNELSVIFNRHWNKVCRRAIRIGIKKDIAAFSKRISLTNKRLFKEGIRTNRGDKNPNWKGGITKKYAGIDHRQYNNVHNWLKREFGYANKCENYNCLGGSKTFQWAKIRNKKYIKDRDNFMMLCKSCHALYDLNKNYVITTK